MKKKVIQITLAVVGIFLYVLVTSANINPLYQEGAFFWCVVISIVGAILFLKEFLDISVEPSTTGGINDIKFNPKSTGSKKKLLLFAVPWIIYGVVNIVSMPLFNSSAYATQMAEAEVSVFSSDIQTLDVDNIPVVDSALATILADKKLGEKSSLGSQVTLGDPVMQTVNGELVWVVPLYHSGFFKWFSNSEGTPGYIIVSATNPSDVEYVEDYLIKYQPNAYFFDNLDFKSRFSEAIFTGITDYSFELDDTGRPYWVITTYENQWGFALPEATGVLLMDCETGETTMYGLDEIPDWVDRVQPEEYIITQLDNQGEYIHGVLNFSNLDKFETSDGSVIVYNEGRCYLLTGLTSVGSDESAIGFVMVDMVTKEVYKYAISGATESAAQSSAEGTLQYLEYTASFPVILNIGGEATYFMSMKDKEGLIKQYALVSVKDYLTVGTGETVAGAIASYEIAMANSTGTSDLTFNIEKEEISGVIDRISYEITDTTTVYKFTLVGDSQIYQAVYDLNAALALTREGDEVTLSYYIADDSEVLTVAEFKNNTIF